jgi:uncharacterized iron-regulated membrane protein
LLLEGQAHAWLVRDRANAVGFDLRDGRLLDRRDGRDMNLHQRIAEMADPLHFGSFGGWAGADHLVPLRRRIDHALFHRRLSLWPARRRCIAIGAQTECIVSDSNISPWKAAWRGMGRWRWLWLVLVLVWLGLMPLELMK